MKSKHASLRGNEWTSNLEYLLPVKDLYRNVKNTKCSFSN